MRAEWPQYDPAREYAEEEQRIEWAKEVVRAVRLARVNYIVTTYAEMLENEFPISEDSLKAYFEKNGNPVRPKLSFEESKQDISDYLLFPQNILKQAFYFNYEMNNGKSIDDIRRKVFSENIREFRRNRMDRKRAEAWTAANVHVYRQSLNIKGPKMVLSAMEQVADSLAKEHNYNGAIDQWKEIRFVYPENDTLFAKVDGTVKFERMDKTRKQVSVYSQEA